MEHLAVHTRVVEFTPPAGVPGGSCTLSTHLCGVHCSGNHPQLCQSKFKISPGSRAWTEPGNEASLK